MHRSIHFTLVTLLLVLGLCSSGFAQQLRFERLADKEGLYKRTITCGLQDRRGFMWFGSEDGLLRYDGYNFKEYIYQPDNDNSLSSNLVYSLLEDRDGNLWIGTVGGGLNRYNPNTETFTRYKHNPDDASTLSHNGVVSLLEDSQGRIWVGTEGGGLNRLDPGENTFHRYQHDPQVEHSISFDSMWHLYEDGDGQIWIGTHGGGLNVLNPETGHFKHFTHNPDDPSTLASNVVGPIFEDSKGRFWVGGIGGLNLLDRASGRVTRYEHNPDDPTSIPDNHVWDLYEDDEGFLWIGSFGGGVSRFNPDDMVFQSLQHRADDLTSLSSNLVWCIVKSDDGVLWIGTDGGGLNKFSALTMQFNHFTEFSDGIGRLAYNGVNAIDEDSSGVLWMANDGGGIQFLDLKSGASRQFLSDARDPRSLSSNLTEVLLVDHEDVVWIGTYNGGLNRYDPRTGLFSHYRHDPSDSRSLTDNRVWSVFEDSQHALWVGTRNGLNRMDRAGNVLRHYLHEPEDQSSLSDNGIWTVYEDSSGTIWVGTDNGLNRLESDGSFKRYYSDSNDPHTLSHDNITAIYESSDQSFWVGTNGGLNKFDRGSGRVIRYSEIDGLASNSIRGILEDSEHNLWITTVKGLSRFSAQSGEFDTYRYRDGLQGTEFSRAAVRLDDGRIVIGGRNGINLFDPLKVRKNMHRPAVVLTDFSTINHNGAVNSRAIRDKYQLSYRDATLMFNFAALDYNNSLANRYQYKLEGFDSEWIAAGTRHLATYTNLGGGDYTLRVRGANNHGLWSRDDLVVPISITWAPWLRWWAWVIYACLTMLLIWLFVENRARQHRKELALVETANSDLRKEIKERERAEEALSQSEERLLLALNAAHEGIWEYNPQTGQGYLSPSWFAMLGYPVDAFEHSYYNWEALLHPDDRTAVLDEFGRYLSEEQPSYEGEFRLRGCDGSWVWVYATGKVLERDVNDSPVRVAGIHMDISSRKQVEEETQRLQSALQHASKMEAVGTLAGGIAHDFNNILAAIIGNCELGLRTVDDKHPLFKRLLQILQASVRAKELVQQILTFTRKGSSRHEPVVIADVCDEALGLLRSSIPVSTAMNIDLSRDIGPVLADPTQIHQVIVNLCTNAAHAMEDTGGELRVTLREVQLSQGEMPISAQIVPGRYNELKISDDGSGIPREEMDKIFNPYFSTKEPGKGSGLGLSVVQGIVQSCAGDIQVESVVGRGTTFTVLLPVTTQASSFVGTIDDADDQTMQRPADMSCTALIVDDEADIVSVVSAQLQSMGHQGIGFTDAQEALDFLANNPTACDLVITDMAMPEITGVEVAERVKSARGDMPVILCSGYSKEVFSRDHRELGVDIVLQKPVRMAQLQQALYDVMA